MAAIRSHTTDTTDEPWNAADNVANLKTGADESYYKQMFAYQDPDADPTTKSAYSYPHHMVSEDGTIGAANMRACSSGIAALNGARGGHSLSQNDRKMVYNHLSNHLDDAGQDVPELASVASTDGALARAVDLETKRYVYVSLRELKTDDNGVFSGYASAYAKDLQGDKIQPGAFARSIAQKRGQIPIFYNHDDGEWIGLSTSLAEDGRGLALTGQLFQNSAGQDAYQLLKGAAALGYRVGMSIGFTANDWDYGDDSMIRTLKEIDLWEASLTPFPAQPKAFVSDVKRIRELEKFLSRAESRRNAIPERTVTVRGNRLLRGLLAQMENR